MSFSLRREIYGATHWQVQLEAVPSLRSIIVGFRNGITNTTSVEIKNNSIDIFDAKSQTKLVTDVRQLNRETIGESFIYVINLNGVIVKNGGASTYGTKEISAQIMQFEKDNRIIGGVMVVDSVGGSSYGREVLRHTLTQRKKPLVSLLERGGVMASAAYGIGAATDWIISESENGIVGSLGTFTEMEGIPNGERNGDNAKVIRVYATKSTAKNAEWEEALNKDNIQLIIDNQLNPSNEAFLKDIKKDRPQVLESQLDGSTYRAGDVIGSLVDQIGTFSDAMNKVIELSEAKPSLTNSNKNSKNKINNKAMTAQELKSQHPETYQEIFGAGVQKGISAEKDRVGTWMAHANTDLEAVKKGIEDGGKMTATARENFLVKQASMKQLGDLKSESAKDLNPGEAKSEEKELSEADAFYKEIAEEVD